MEGKPCVLPEAVKGRFICPVAAVLCTAYTGALLQDFPHSCLQLSKEIDDYAAVVLKPIFKSKQLSKEGYKWVVRSTVEKVGHAALEQECPLAAVGHHCTLIVVGNKCPCRQLPFPPFSEHSNFTDASGGVLLLPLMPTR